MNTELNMKRTKQFVASALVLAFSIVIAACSGESSSSPNNSGNATGSSDGGDGGKVGDGKVASVCGFKKSENVWKFSYSTWNISEEYTWVGESTVEFKEYMNAYHMDEDDTTYTDVDRDEFFDRIMERCLDLNDLLEESSSSGALSDEPESSSDKASTDKSAESSSSKEADDEPGFTVTEICTEIGACDAMVKSDVDTWHFIRKDAFGDDAEYIYRADGRDLIVTIKNADGTTESKTYSMYNMESEVGVEMAYSAARSTCKDGGGNDNVIRTCVVDTVYSSSSTPSSSSYIQEVVDPSTVVTGSMTDERDGQTYKTVKIGNQVWMAENLNYAYTGRPYNYRGYTSDSSSWCPINEEDNCSKYGRLYTWAVAMDSAAEFSDNGKGCGIGVECSPTYPVRGICPEGWHLPSRDEWNTLLAAVGDSSTTGFMLKSSDGWDDCDGKFGGGTDAYLFSALPASYVLGGSFTYTGGSAWFWSSSEFSSGRAYIVELWFCNKNAIPCDMSMYDGYSVRCIKD